MGPAQNKSGELIKEQKTFYDEARQITRLLQCDYESFFLFGTIFLDHIALFIEEYFGKTNNGGRIQKHRSLNNKLTRYATEKELVLPEGFAESITYLEDNLAEFRDKEITHDKSWRSMHGFMHGPDRETSIMKTKLYPKKGDDQVEGEQPRVLLEVIDKYIDQLISLIETNRSKTQLQLKEGTAR